jgi:lipoprotein-anchoring transpeptidase ErfK/SrfK
MATPPLRLTPKIIIVNKETYLLTLWRIKLNAYVIELQRQITLGAIGHETPIGLYFVEAKNSRPDWRAPDADWVEPPELRGTIIPFDDPKNPFLGGFMSIANTDGVGIHGTKFDPRTGTMSSHGCIRMLVGDYVLLHKKTALGTPVFIY